MTGGRKSLVISHCSKKSGITYSINNISVDISKDLPVILLEVGKLLLTLSQFLIAK